MTRMVMPPAQCGNCGQWSKLVGPVLGWCRRLSDEYPVAEGVIRRAACTASTQQLSCHVPGPKYAAYDADWEHWE